MPAFKRFGPGDQVDNVLILEPRYDLVSGSEGWRGSPEGSASLSLYGGARRRPGVFSSIEYQSFAPNVNQTGNPRLGQPLTASVNYVYATDEPLSLSQVTNTRWGEEHWDVLQRLYQDYRVLDPDYVTGSYDYYCLYFNGDSQNRASIVMADANGDLTPAGKSFTTEAWIKPFTTSSAGTNPFFTVHTMGGGGVPFGNNDGFLFGITGSNGHLFLTSSMGSFTSSVGVPIRRWSHVACVFDESTLTGTFYLNLQDVGSFSVAAADIANSPVMSIGSISNGDNPGPGLIGTSFDGLVGENRFWQYPRTHTQLSESLTRQLTLGELSGCLSYVRFTEGPRFTGMFGETVGSSSIDFAAAARGVSGLSVTLASFNDRVGPTWHPNDNVGFRPAKREVERSSVSVSGALLVASTAPPDPLRRLMVVDVPSAFYGRQVVPGSVRMTCRAFEDFGFVRTLVDDGRGGLYLSGSVCSSSLADREEYAGVGWNKVGNVFYGEGLIVIKDPALFDFGRTDGAPLMPTDTLSLSFRGDSRVPVKTLMCRVDHGEFNCSNNPTFYTTGSAGERLPRHPSGSIRATTVGIYNSDRELVAVARLADPVRIRARDRLNIKLRLDF